MNIREGVLLALGQIRAQKLKSFFAVLGVIIGVMFLITVVSVVEGMNRYMEEDFARTIYGLNTLTLSRTPEIQMSGDAGHMAGIPAAAAHHVPRRRRRPQRLTCRRWSRWRATTAAG
jgi:ABC-type lipoprotein release transport system permease subunit